MQHALQKRTIKIKVKIEKLIKKINFMCIKYYKKISQ